MEVTHSYDVYNRWIGRVVDPDGDAGSDPLEATYFVYDGSQIVLQFDGDAAADLTNRYLWAGAVDQILADEQVTTLSSAGDVYWPLTDHQGTVRQLAFYDSGSGDTTIQRYWEYDSFGNVTSETAAAVDHLFGYTGRAFDDETGLQNNLHRWYDPVVGRWASEDPIGFAAGDANLYRYVGNGPTNGVDPTGLDYVTSKGGKVYWQTEEDGYTYNPDRARHEIGSLGQDGVVTLNEEYGGGRRHIDDLRDSADKFWNLFPDISDLDFSDQRWYIRGALANSSLRSSIRDYQRAFIALNQGLDAGGSSICYAYSRPIYYITGYDLGATEYYEQAWETAGLHGTWVQKVSDISSGVSATAAYAAGGLQVAATAEAGGLLGITNAGVVPLQAVPATLYVEATVVSMTGTMAPAAYVYNMSTGTSALQAATSGRKCVVGSGYGKAAPKGTVGKFDVGPYNQMKGKVPGMNAHHAGQSAAMKKVVKGYDHNTAPTILVPKVGHTIKGPRGIVSRSTKGLDNARDILARDLRELRRVYPGVPNSKLKELIEMNKRMFPEMRK